MNENEILKKMVEDLKAINEYVEKLQFKQSLLTDALNLALNENFSGKTTLSDYCEREIRYALENGK